MNERNREKFQGSLFRLRGSAKFFWRKGHEAWTWRMIMHRATEMLAVLVGRTESSHIPLGRNLSPGAKTHDCALKYIKLDTSELALPSLWQYTWDKWIHKGGKLTRVHAFRALWHVTAWCGSMVKKNCSPPGSQEADRQRRDRTIRGVGVPKSPQRHLLLIFPSMRSYPL